MDALAESHLVTRRDEANALLSKKDFAGALRIYLELEKEVAAEPPSEYRAKLYLNTGRALQSLERAEEALPYFLRAMEENPPMPKAHFFAGKALRSLGKLDDALRELRLSGPEGGEPDLMAVPIIAAIEKQLAQARSAATTGARASSSSSSSSSSASSSSTAAAGAGAGAEPPPRAAPAPSLAAESQAAVESDPRHKEDPTWQRFDFGRLWCAGENGMAVGHAFCLVPMEWVSRWRDFTGYSETSDAACWASWLRQKSRLAPLDLEDAALRKHFSERGIPLPGPAGGGSERAASVTRNQLSLRGESTASRVKASGLVPPAK